MMRSHRWRRAAIIVVALFAIVALGTAAVTQVRRRRLEPFRERTREYLQLALVRDSIALARLSVDESAAANVLAVVARNPGKVMRAAQTLELNGGRYSPERVAVWFDSAENWCGGYEWAPPGIQLEFVRRGDAWLVKFAAVGVC